MKPKFNLGDKVITLGGMMDTYTGVITDIDILPSFVMYQVKPDRNQRKGRSSWKGLYWHESSIKKREIGG